MRVDGYCPSFSRHLEPRKINLVLNAELGLTVENDAAVYISAVLQHTVERLVAGALSSCDKADFRSEASTHMDVKPRHLQVILSVFLDHATEVLFDRLGLPIHSKEALAASEYYKTVVDGLQHIKPAQPCCIGSNANKDLPPSLTTPAQMARIVAGVNPLCSMSPKACLMVDALVHETFMALCEGIARRRPDSRVITVADLEDAIRDFFPQGLASQATRVATAAVSSLAEDQAVRSGYNTFEGGVPLDGGAPDERVTLCLRRLQGTRTVLRKTFKVAPGNLLFAVFRKACDRLRLPEGSVVFVHNGAILSGRREARTLASGPGCRPVQVFAVCKKDWACKQREAARRGFLIGQGDSLDPSEATKRSRFQLHETTHKDGQSKLYQSGSVPGLSKPWKQKPRHLASYNTDKAGGAHPGQPKREGKHQTSRVLPPLPDGLGASKEMLRDWGAEISSEPRRTRRWITTPDDGAKVDLARLENTRPLPPRPLGAFRSQLPESVSMRVLVGSDKEAGGVSPRIGRTVRRLADMEACLRNLDDSMRELQAGDPGGSSSGVPTIALAAINSQLDVAYNLSSLCRQVLSVSQGDSRQEGDPANDRTKLQNPFNSSLTLGGRGHEHQYSFGKVNQDRIGGDSFLTEVPSGGTSQVNPRQPRLPEEAPHAARSNTGDAMRMPPVADANGPATNGAINPRAERGRSDGEVQADGRGLSHEFNSSGGTHGGEGGRAVVDEAEQGQVQPPARSSRSGLGHVHKKKEAGGFKGSPYGHDVGHTARGNVEPRGGLVSGDEQNRGRSFTGGGDAYHQEGSGGGRNPMAPEHVPLPEQTGQYGGQVSGKARPGDAHVDISGRGGLVQPGGEPSFVAEVRHARALHALPLDREQTSIATATAEQGPEVQGVRQSYQRQPVARETVPPAVGAERSEDGKGQEGSRMGGPAVGVKEHMPLAGLLGVKGLPRVLPLDDSEQQQPGEDDDQGSGDEYLEGDDDHDEGGGGGDWSSWLA